MSHSLVEVVQACLIHHGVSGQAATVALSGGVDSMVLLHAVHSLQSILGIRLDAIHVNHGLNPKADDWAVFCQDQCRRLDVCLSVSRVDVDRQSGAGLEAAARDARYEAFSKSVAAFVLSAQHADDQAETVLHQLLRGTGLKGLAAMGERRVLKSGQTLLRPLLSISRGQIEDYAIAHVLPWVEDDSNLDQGFTRNFIRHTLVPAIADRFPHYRDSLARTALHAAESAVLLEALAKLDLQWDGATARADVLDGLSLSRQVNALYYWLRWQGMMLPSRDQLETWAGQLFRPAPLSKPHRAGGHDWVIRRRAHVLSIERVK